MTLGSTLASRAVGDAARRNFASEWGGPDPAAVRRAAQRERSAREPDRHVTMRKP